MTDAADHPEFASLLAALLDGELDEAQERRLMELASADAALMQRYLDTTELHAVLRWEMQWACPPSRGHTDYTPPRRERASRRTLVRYAAAAAIVLGFTAAMSLLVTMGGSHRVQAEPMVATLIDADHAEWAPGEAHSVGDPLGGGFLHLRSGTATVEFIRGARVTLTGPCDFGLNAPMRGELRRGRITALVPASAHGFTVAGPGCAVIDLGTAFSLRVTESRATELHVLTGRVRVEFDDHAPPIELTPSRGLLLAAVGDPPVMLDDTPPPIGVTTTGQVELTVEPTDLPRAISPSVKLFRERQDVTLTHPLEVSFTDAALHDRFNTEPTSIPAGERVSSFLLHFRPGSAGRLVQDGGTVTFDHPILGVIAQTRPLNISDATLGRGDLPYPLHDRGLEGTERGWTEDTIQISPDRRTLRFRFGAKTGVDEARIVVKAAPNPETPGAGIPGARKN